MNGPQRFVHPITAARQANHRRVEGKGEEGFTLIELIIVVAILPIIVGGIAVALISVLSLNGSVSNRITDSNDSLVASVNFNKDIQSAQEMTTQTSPACAPSPAPTNPVQTQLLGLEWGANASAPGGYNTVVSYVSIPVVNAATHQTSYSMLRQVCTYTSGSSLALTSQATLAHDVGSGPMVTIYGPANGPITPMNNFTIVTPEYAAGWKSSIGVTKVAFSVSVSQTGNSYSYSLVGLPGQSTTQGSTTTTTAPSGPDCNFATPGSGTYANDLCFADFTGLDNPPILHSSGQCQTMLRPIVNTPYTLSFCISVSSNNIGPYQIPTYYAPGSSGYNSEAYLGNNGFYVGIAGDPALYQHQANGAQWNNTLVYITNIQVLDAANQPASGWTLVTGDAESTDSQEWLIFQSSLNFSVLDNNGTSDPYGNACYDSGDDFGGNQNVGFLAFTGSALPVASQAESANNTAIPTNQKAALPVSPATFPATGTNSVLCESDQQLNKTGTLMLQAQEPTNSTAPQSLTVDLEGHGYGQAFFLGVLI